MVYDYEVHHALQKMQQIYIWAIMKQLLPDLLSRLVLDEEYNWIDVCTMKLVYSIRRCSQQAMAILHT